MKHHFLSAIIMALSLVPITSHAYDFSAVNDDGVTIYYNILSEEEKTCEVTYHIIYDDIDEIHVYKGHVNIPSTVSTYKVVSIGESAFENCNQLESVTIPNCVESIGAGAFRGCTSLNTIYIPSSIKAMQSYAFYRCNGLQKVIVEDIASWCNISFFIFVDYGFDGGGFGCNYSNPLEFGRLYSDENTEITNLIIPNTVKRISDGAFYKNKSLTSVAIPNTVDKISQYAFYNCNNLTTVKIPKSVSVIDSYAFNGCTGLQKVIIEDVGSWCNMTVWSNPLEYGRLYSDENTEITNLVVPNTVTSIRSSAFKNCTGIKSVTIPNSVTSIGYYAFEGCTGIKSVTIPNTVTSIGEGAFITCTQLESVSIPSSVAEIEQSVFKNCSGLTSVTMEDGVSSIGKEAFSGCTQLKTILIPNSVEEVGINAFQGTAWYEDLPDGVVYIGKTAYKYKGTMTNGTSVVIEPGTKSIIESAFYNCRGLTSITIPSSVTTIGNYAFSGCTNLSTVYSEITDFFDIDKSVFKGSENTTLYVPKGMATTYRSSTGWSVIKYIEEMPDDTPDASFLISCSNRGSVSINGSPSITNKIAAASINEGTDNTFTFTPNPGCRLDQVILNGLDITANVQNKTLTCTIPANSQMIVTFTSEQGDINNDGRIDISDVVSIVNKILGIQ